MTALPGGSGTGQLLSGARDDRTGYRAPARLHPVGRHQSWVTALDRLGNPSPKRGMASRQRVTSRHVIGSGDDNRLMPLSSLRVRLTVRYARIGLWRVVGAQRVAADAVSGTWSSASTPVECGVPEAVRDDHVGAAPAPLSGDDQPPF